MRDTIPRYILRDTIPRYILRDAIPRYKGQQKRRGLAASFAFMFTVVVQPAATVKRARGAAWWFADHNS
ncbi:hypothetical protein [Candidatus Promineifilum breve]|uniref:hypothetical protein n=1 Tax=Candidatus Promineifilum breve TaxID=1806508 RepID=UPI0012FFC3D8|nr:hypothetical protein [Candidatus Promineifilum breve]